MQSEVTELPLDGGDILESVIIKGDLAKLTPQERVQYYKKTCETIGLNPFTRPLAYINLNNQLRLYALRDCTDQLRRIHNISVEVVDQRIDGELYTVHARARVGRTGRKDEDFGAVTVANLKGEARANAQMKAVTKAKRRVTLSICGLGYLDETEVDDIDGVVPIEPADTTAMLDQFAAGEPPVRDLVAEGRSASLKGRKAFQDFWVPLTSEQRLSLAEHREAFWEAAEKADGEPEPVGR